MKKMSLIALLSAACLLLCSCGRINIQGSESKENNSESNVSAQEEIRAVWISYNELSLKNSADKSEDAFREKAESITANAKQFGFNRIIVQVRPFSDAFYNSEIFPATEYLSGEQGVYIGYDALEIFVEAAKSQGISIDAWINPYRISYNTDYTLLAQSNPAKKWLMENPQARNVIITDKGIFYNPASYEAQRLIIDGVREILKNYDVDGIHIDDYFYPTTDESFDADDYTDYVSLGGRLSLDDWRRENVNALVSGLYSAIKAEKSDAVFSVSPSGDIEKNINSYYADVNLWCSTDGYIDIIMPQLYYGFENASKPFLQASKDWSEIIKSENVKLCFGLAFYKCGKLDENAGSGKEEWLTNSDIISREITTVREYNNYAGFSLYSYSYIFSDNSTDNAKKELQLIKNML